MRSASVDDSRSTSLSSIGLAPNLKKANIAGNYTDEFGLSELENQLKAFTQEKSGRRKTKNATTCTSHSSGTKENPKFKINNVLQKKVHEVVPRSLNNSTNVGTAKSKSKETTKAGKNTFNLNKENINMFNLIKQSMQSESTIPVAELLRKQTTRNSFSTAMKDTATFNASKNLKMAANAKPSITPVLKSKPLTNMKTVDDSTVSNSSAAGELIDTNTLIKLISSLEKQRTANKPKKNKYLQDYERSKTNCIKFRGCSLERRNRHSKSFTINISPRMINRAERLLSMNKSKYSISSTSCRRQRPTAIVTCGNSSPYKLIDTEVKKVKSKHRKDVAYMKKNMARRLKRTIQEMEGQAVHELTKQEENHKKAVFKITKNWEVERQSLEDRNKFLEQENVFIRNELNEYKGSHDSMIKEIERLKKIIDDLEEENDAYKEHIAAQIQHENYMKNNK